MGGGHFFLWICKWVLFLQSSYLLEHLLFPMIYLLQYWFNNIELDSKFLRPSNWCHHDWNFSFSLALRMLWSKIPLVDMQCILDDNEMICLDLFAIFFESLVELLSILNESNIPLLSLFIPINVFSIFQVFVIVLFGKLIGKVILFSFDPVQNISVINKINICPTWSRLTKT